MPVRPGDVVEHDRQVHRVGERHKMTVKTFLRGLVVVRVDRQARRHADFFGKAVQINGLARGVGSDPRDHRHAAGGKLDG